ncbi:hypothetical protein CHS0354_003912 [Potamilus streckersoni]|uniref:SAM domain-containing protein n=1 Tax=Potamilus streckersoni TaxID=2493646 RepID=A0AAE0S3U6_9BIVA|nr:hypothetical protein CHS0354_003912 [Potamilus streckersoni]
MLFESDKVSYRVSEFFEKFKGELPKIVMVAQGFHGDIITDTFDREQVIRVHTHSRQWRVVAVTLEETNRKLGHYSIPVDYRLKFCVKKGSAWKENKCFTLREIIEKNKLPVEVQFAKEENVTVGSRSMNTSRFPALRLTHTFEETYLLGNFINSGVMDPRYVPIPLYLKDLRLSLITGIKGRSREHWKSFQDDLTSIANTALRYDLNYGKEDIAIYADAVGLDALYEELQPNLYADPFEFFRYQVINPSYALEDGNITSSTFMKDDPADSTPMMKKLPAVPEKPMKSSYNPYSSMPVNIPPALPARNPETSKIIVDQRNNLHEQLPPTSVREVTPKRLDDALPDDIEQYMIKDVTEALMRLKLEKYIPEFTNQMIDGRMLRALDETILREDFHFTRIEALRLMNFAKNGHIPT